MFMKITVLNIKISCILALFFQACSIFSLISKMKWILLFVSTKVYFLCPLVIVMGKYNLTYMLYMCIPGNWRIIFTDFSDNCF